MTNYICRSCSANNNEPGRCVLCSQSLGSLKIAILAAATSCLLLSICWIALAALTQSWIPLLALVFGGVIALCTSHFSGGRGLIYQMIATGFTLIGIVCSECLITLIFIHRDSTHLLQITDLDSVFRTATYQILYDPALTLFSFLGISGSFFIWRDPSPRAHDLEMHL
ncbi:hypothetical protein HW115_15150 [Verrucomicrobiaceae bacterium N1E253]|uniref:Uncharacterized protein n=1 Tax=Oceaniferula marina TaxID=2748318 RepID=A0A851GGP2_9BACT|nr:hypothetical protein [Oceaniferula marina]NWK56958.1 hypothetical protein [Oceaniferula marina]